MANKVLSNAPEHTLREFYDLAEVELDAGNAVMGIGPRGIGKTEAAMALAKRRNRTYVPFILGHKEKSDLLIPRFDPETKGILEYPLGTLKQACVVPSLVHFDEFNRVEDSLQSAILTIVNERVIGDWKFHPETDFLLTGNPPDHAGANTPLDTLIGRCWVSHIRAEIDEVRGYLSNLGADASTERRLGVDYAATAGQRPDLIACEPPAGADASGSLYPQPRQVVKGLKALAKFLDRGGDLGDSRAMAILSGHVGTDTAAAMVTIWKLRDKLPTIEAVVKDPAGAKLPSDIESAVAALGLVSLVHKQGKPGVDAAWIYTGRLAQYGDIQQAITRNLIGQLPTDPKALAVHVKLVGGAGALISDSFGA